MGNNVSYSMQAMINDFENRSKQNISSVVDNNVKVRCENIQTIKNSTLDNCKVNFSEQTCAASVMSNFVGSNVLDVKLVQDVYKDSLQDVEDDQTNEDYGAGTNKSYKSQFEYNKIRVINDTVMHLYTDCSRNVNAINEQSIENTTCSGASEINFAAQVNTPTVVADCAADQAGNLEASQFLTALSTQKAKTTQTNSGGLMGFVLLLLMIPLLLFLIPFAIRKGFSFGARSMNGKTIVGLICLVMLLLALVIWWPGWFSKELGVWPYPFPYYNVAPEAAGGGGSRCIGGTLAPGLKFLNTGIFWDNLCLVSDDFDNCDDEKRVVSYDMCGLFAKNQTVQCDDPDFIADRDAFIQAHKACETVSGSIFDFCTPISIAGEVFPDEKTFERPYGECKKCNSGPANGFYINAEAECSSARFDLNRWAALGEVSGGNYKMVENICPDGDTNCVATEEELFAAGNEDDCGNPGYQNTKAKVIKLMEGCTAMNTAMQAIDKHNPDLANPRFTIKEQCKFGVADFLVCDQTDACYYIPTGCTFIGTGDEPGTREPNEVLEDWDCTGAEEKVASCRNDFSRCGDAEAKADMAADAAMAELCKNQWETWESRHWMLFYVTIGLYVGLLALGILMMFLGGNQNRKEDSLVAKQT